VSVLVDTSALYALLDEADANHDEAADILRRLAGAELVTHSFIVVEATALVGRRLPWAASEALLDGILPVVEVLPVESTTFAAALPAYRQARFAAVSLVDQASFALMRSRGIRRAFAFDAKFARAGFELVT
jgi:predicted nucleic acid-binding protein